MRQPDARGDVPALSTIPWSRAGYAVVSPISIDLSLEEMDMKISRGNRLLIVADTDSSSGKTSLAKDVAPLLQRAFANKVVRVSGSSGGCKIVHRRGVGCSRARGIFGRAIQMYGILSIASRGRRTCYDVEI